MRMIDIINKKRLGEALSDNEIKYFINGYTKGEIPDYQVSALLMAIMFRSMDETETAVLTYYMAHSGEMLDLSCVNGFKVDKHSTGGIGDKTSLICVPVAAACGVIVPKMSGRGLGFTGGTIDKLESIPGMNVALSKKQFIEAIEKIGLCITGQTGNLAPADKLLYALRDATDTIANIPLIASSIMSKKIAMGAEGIVLDVKYGNGAFMKTKEDAELLSKAMILIGEKVNRKTVAIISDMNEPLGNAIGNSIEVIEAIETLKGKGPEDLEKVSLEIASNMVALSRKKHAKEFDEIYEECYEVLHNGMALNKFKQMIYNQGGDFNVLDNYSLFGESKYVIPYKANKSGMIHNINALKIGNASCVLGAGRKSVADRIDYNAGIYLNCKSNTNVKAGDILATLYTNQDNVENALEFLKDAWYIE